jgi:uncharacterized Zn finger protein
MFKALLMKDLIQERINFRAIHTGWSVGKCELCGDYKERAGFKFEDNKVVFNCWNCGKASVYEEFSGEISNNMRNILTRFGIDDSEISNVVNSAFFRKEEEKQVIIPNKTETVIDIPKKSIQLADTRSPTYLGQTPRRITQRSENHYSEEFVAKNFKSYRIGEVLNISSKRYTVSKIPNIDYSRTYLPFFLLVRNGFLREN